MQHPTTDATKRAVIEVYLRGKSRDQIAADLRIGTGTVSTIISEWKTGLDYPIPEELHELALALQKLGISASRYAEGVRIASYLSMLGVHDEEFHHFISGIYDRCKKMDLQPDKIASLLKQLLTDVTNTMPRATVRLIPKILDTIFCIANGLVGIVFKPFHVLTMKPQFTLFGYI